MEANIPHTRDDIEPLHFDKIYNKQATLYPQPDDEYGTALCVNLSDGAQFRLVLLKENRKRKDGSTGSSKPRLTKTPTVIFSATTIIWLPPSA